MTVEIDCKVDVVMETCQFTLLTAETRATLDQYGDAESLLLLLNIRTSL